MEVRKAARMVVLDGDGKVAIISVGANSGAAAGAGAGSAGAAGVGAAEYYKIPGGGVEEGEEILAAARRETREETGCETEVIGELGRIETDIPGWNLHDVSDGFLGKVVGEKGTPEYDDFEKERGFSVGWWDLDETIEMMEKHGVADMDKRMLQMRDLEFLRLAREFLRGR